MAKKDDRRARRRNLSSGRGLLPQGATTGIPGQVARGQTRGESLVAQRAAASGAPKTGAQLREAAFIAAESAAGRDVSQVTIRRGGEREPETQTFFTPEQERRRGEQESRGLQRELTAYETAVEEPGKVSVREDEATALAARAQTSKERIAAMPKPPTAAEIEAMTKQQRSWMLQAEDMAKAEGGSPEAINARIMEIYRGFAGAGKTGRGMVRGGKGSGKTRNDPYIITDKTTQAELDALPSGAYVKLPSGEIKRAK